MNSEFLDRLSMVSERLNQAAQKSKRSLQDIQIVAVTKGHDAASVRVALEAGLLQIGESRVREAGLKKEEVGKGTWRLIGHLQSNKVKEAVHVFDAIDSVDSLALAEEIQRRAHEVGRNMPILLQLNVSGEPSKFGAKPDDAVALCEAINAMPRLELRGFMTLAPFYKEPEKARPVFAALRTCRDRVAAQTGMSLPELSMGMSHDFEIAAEEGSTLVRLGTVLFGARPKRAPNGPIDELESA